MKKIEHSGKTIELPFDCEVYTDEKVTLTNPYTLQSEDVPGFAASVYDVIKGAEHLGDYQTMQKGLIWFREHFAKEYLTLLD